MFEVEAKIHISKSEFEYLRKRLTKEVKTPETRVSADTYYERLKFAFIRIRQNGEKFTFGIKRRETIEGIESNVETEWGIKDVKKWRSLLSRLNIRTSIRKTKNSFVFRLEDFGIELHRVSRLGYFLEIEKLISHKEEVREAKNKLIKLFARLGYSPKRFESKPYLQLLEEKCLNS